MLFVITAEDRANSVGKLVSTEQPLGLNYLAFAVYPFGFYGVKPRAPGRQQTRHYPDPTAAIFDLAVVGGDPLSHLSAFVPACVVPDKQQSLLASRLEPVATPPEKLCAYGAHRSTIDEPQPRLLKLRQIKCVAGEGLRGSGSSLRLASFWRRRIGWLASVQQCTEGLSKRENQVSSSKPNTHSGWASASRISRSRPPFFSRTLDLGFLSSVSPSANAPQGAPGWLGWSLRLPASGLDPSRS
jgi:hypothetical protein